MGVTKMAQIVPYCLTEALRNHLLHYLLSSGMISGVSESQSLRHYAILSCLPCLKVLLQNQLCMQPTIAIEKHLPH